MNQLAISPKSPLPLWILFVLMAAIGQSGRGQETAIKAGAAATSSLAKGEPKGDRLFVAVGYGGRRMSSPDGIIWQHEARWSDPSQDNDDVLFNIAFGQGKFVAVGGGASIGHILVTKDGKDWKELPQHKGRVATVAFGDGRFVAGHGKGFLWSNDGEDWQVGAQLEFDRGIYFRRSAYGNGRFVSIGDCDFEPGKPRKGWRACTADGRQVVSFTAGIASVSHVAFGGPREGGQFVIVGSKGFCETSPDGEIWTAHKLFAEPGEHQDLQEVVWSGKEFLISYAKGMFTSPDGLTWKPVPGLGEWLPCQISWADEHLALGMAWEGKLLHSSNRKDFLQAKIPVGPAFNAISVGVVEGK